MSGLTLEIGRAVYYTTELMNFLFMLAKNSSGWVLILTLGQNCFFYLFDAFTVERQEKRKKKEGIIEGRRKEKAIIQREKNCSYLDCGMLHPFDRRINICRYWFPHKKMTKGSRRVSAKHWNWEAKLNLKQGRDREESFSPQLLKKSRARSVGAFYLFPRDKVFCGHLECWSKFKMKHKETSVAWEAIITASCQFLVSSAGAVPFPLCPGLGAPGARCH